MGSIVGVSGRLFRITIVNAPTDANHPREIDNSNHPSHLTKNSEITMPNQNIQQQIKNTHSVPQTPSLLR